MTIIIFQPKGAGTAHKEGSIVVQAPKGSGTHWGSANYTLTGVPLSVPGVATGTINASYSGRFDDPRYYQGDTSS